MKQFFLISFFAIFSFAFNTESYCQSGIGKPSPSKSDKESVKYTFSLFQQSDSTWCYDIFKNSKLFIHQTSIPGLPGNEGFKNKSDAEKVARLVIEKLYKGEVLPTVTNEELRKLNVLN